MIRKIYITILVAVFLVTFVSLGNAHPQSDVQVGMMYLYQGYSSKILGCQDDDPMCQSIRTGHTISKYGCALASMAMLYGSYGFARIPDDQHHSLYPDAEYLNLDTLNNYLAKDLRLALPVLSLLGLKNKAGPHRFRK